MLTITEELQVACDAVEQAAQATITIQQGIQAVQTLNKQDRSPVTVADYAAQAIITHILETRLGAFHLVAEESARLLRHGSEQTLFDAVQQAVRPACPEISPPQLLDCLDAGDHDASAESYWTLDPVDGTKGFLRGEHYAISLALIKEGEVQLGILACPRLPANLSAELNCPDASGMLFLASRGEGCWSRPLGQNLPFSRCQSEAADEDRLRLCESVELAHSDHQWSKQLAASLGCEYRSIQLDSQCKYGVVARGQADAYLRLPTRADYEEKIWDHAAGMLIATEAGLQVSDTLGQPLDFSRGMTLSANRGIVCARPELHQRLIAALLVN